jgi:chemotaxis protein histidine kinase CheA
MGAFVRRFGEESAERLSDLESGISRLETSPGDRDLVNGLMRQAHTVKGGARLLRLKEIQDVAHAMEDALVDVGQSKRVVTPLLVDALMASCKGIRTLLGALRPGEKDAQGPTDVDVAALAAFVREGKPPPGWAAPADPGTGAPPPEAARTGQAAGSTEVTSETGTAELASVLRKTKTGASVRVAVTRLNDLGNLTVEMTVERAKARNRHLRLRSLGFSIARTRASTGGYVADRGPLESAFGELERQHRRMVEESEDELARRSALDEELRDHVQDLRLTPIRVVFDAFPASVREIARGLGKEVDLVMEGGETELDRRIVDEVGEPLVHLVRNSLDHGIEAPKDRARAGKRERGKLTIRARAAEGAIFVEVEDDGRGIDPERLRAAAAARGLMSRDEAARLSDPQALELIFMPGFSTRESVSELSGRGVGMDSVRVSIGRLGGTVAMHSEPGRGTKVTCRLPLTLALLRVVLFRAGPELLAVPLDAAEWVGSFATAGGFGFGEEEEQPLPVVSALEVLGFTESEVREERDPPSFLVLRAGRSRALFVVDEVLEDTEVALKEPPSYLKGSRLVAGVTLLGTGEPAVVLEPAEMLARAMTRRALPVDGPGV